MAEAYDHLAREYSVVNAAMPADLVDFGHRFLSLTGAEARIIDIGCGAGRDMAWLEAQGAAVIGIDLSAGMLAQARSRVKGSLRQMDMRHLDLPAGHFHGAWCMASLLHLPKNEGLRVLGEIRQVLVPGGVLHVSLQEGAGEVWETAPYPAEQPVERFFARYSWDEAHTLLHQAHFRVVESRRNDAATRHWLQFLAAALPSPRPLDAVRSMP